MQAACGAPAWTSTAAWMPLPSPAVVRSVATGGHGVRSCGAVRLTYSIPVLMAVVTYSLLTLALIKISAAGGSQHSEDGLDGSPLQMCTSMEPAVWRSSTTLLFPVSPSTEPSITCQTQQHMRGGRSVPVWNGCSHRGGRPKWNIST